MTFSIFFRRSSMYSTLESNVVFMSMIFSRCFLMSPSFSVMIWSAISEIISGEAPWDDTIGCAY